MPCNANGVPHSAWIPILVGADRRLLAQRGTARRNQWVRLGECCQHPFGFELSRLESSRLVWASPRVFVWSRDGGRGVGVYIIPVCACMMLLGPCIPRAMALVGPACRQRTRGAHTLTSRRGAKHASDLKIPSGCSVEYWLWGCHTGYCAAHHIGRDVPRLASWTRPGCQDGGQAAIQ